MPANTMNYNQVSSVINEIYKIATGQESVAELNGGDVVAVATKTLQTGYDNFANGLSQILSKTIFSARPYVSKFKGLYADTIRYGNHVRKVKPINKGMVNDASLPLTDGESVDPFKISKHKYVQFNFYGQNGYEYDDTLPDWQLDNAVKSAEELGSFMSMFATDRANTIEKYHEETARFTIGNLITGVMATRTNDVIHLLTEYNAQTGLQLTATTVFTPDNYPAFVKWVFSRVNALSSLMTEYSTNYHTNVNDGMFVQSTPKANQKLFISAPFMYDTTARVLADTYHDNMLTMSTTEIVNFWQDIDNPLSLKMTPTILNADGTIAAHTSPITTDKLFGVIMDEETAGYTIVNYRTRTIYNPKGEYTNIFWKFTDRYWNDFTENAVVLLLD